MFVVRLLVLISIAAASEQFVPAYLFCAHHSSSGAATVCVHQLREGGLQHTALVSVDFYNAGQVICMHHHVSSNAPDASWLRHHFIVMSSCLQVLSGVLLFTVDCCNRTLACQRPSAAHPSL